MKRLLCVTGFVLVGCTAATGPDPLREGPSRAASSRARSSVVSCNNGTGKVCALDRYCLDVFEDGAPSQNLCNPIPPECGTRPDCRCIEAYPPAGCRITLCNEVPRGFVTFCNK